MTLNNKITFWSCFFNYGEFGYYLDRVNCIDRNNCCIIFALEKINF